MLRLSRLVQSRFWLLVAIVVLAACNRPQPAGGGSGSGSGLGSGSGSGPGSGSGSGLAADANTATPFGALQDDHLRGELTVSHTLDGAAAAALQAVISNWNRNHAGLQLQLRPVEAADLAAASTASDLIIARHDALDALRAAQRLRPIAPDAAGQHTALPELLAALQQPSGGPYSRPLFFDTWALWFRRDRVTAPPQSWTQPTAGHTGTTPALQWPGNGLEVLVALGQRPDGPAPALGFAALQGWQQAKVGAGQATLAQLVEAMNKGEATLVIASAALLGQVEKHGPWLPALLPALDGGAQPKPWFDVWAVATTTAARQPEVAERIARLLASDESGLAWYEVGKRLPASAKFYENARWASHPVVRLFRAQLRHAVARPPAQAVDVLALTLARALQAAATPGLDPAHAWETAAQTR